MLIFSNSLKNRFINERTLVVTLSYVNFIDTRRLLWSMLQINTRLLQDWVGTGLERAGLSRWSMRHYIAGTFSSVCTISELNTEWNVS